MSITRKPHGGVASVSDAAALALRRDWQAHRRGGAYNARNTASATLQPSLCRGCGRKCDTMLHRRACKQADAVVVDRATRCTSHRAIMHASAAHPGLMMNTTRFSAPHSNISHCPLTEAGHSIHIMLCASTANPIFKHCFPMPCLLHCHTHTHTHGHWCAQHV
jgi:hypothetical protein